LNGGDGWDFCVGGNGTNASDGTCETMVRVP
jgi:hypothetical protein